MCPDEQSGVIQTHPDAQHSQTQEKDMVWMGKVNEDACFGYWEWIVMSNATQRTAMSYETIMTGSFRTAGVGTGEKRSLVLVLRNPLEESKMRYLSPWDLALGIHG